MPIRPVKTKGVASAPEAEPPYKKVFAVPHLPPSNIGERFAKHGFSFCVEYLLVLVPLKLCGI